MSDDLGRALRGTLATAAQEAPSVRPELLDRVEAVRRGRRRRKMAAAALGTAVVVGGAGVLGTQLGTGDGTVPVAAAGALKPVARADLGAPVKVRERWPDAVRELPARLPDGSRLQPVALLDGDILVGTTESSLQRPDRLWSYDLGARRAKVITNIVIPRGSKIFASDFAVGGGRVVWWLSYRVDGRDTVEIWGAPVAGGAAHKITGMPGAEVSTLLIDGDDAVWAASGGVYRAPLTGGAPAKIPGTEGFGIVSWPWIGSPAPYGDKLGYVRYRTLKNVRTGERREARLAPFKGAWSCGVTWCVGGSATGVRYNGGMPPIAVQRRDGKAGRTLPVKGDMLAPAAGVVYGRFLPYYPDGPASKTHLLYDVQTRKMLDTGIRRGNEVMGGRTNERDPQDFFTGDDGTTLLDFSKIG
ncbi:hypothetical protein [Actinomadura chokoriensis]|uniref:hypothetical protein n=1 Tax=Actinomadura chokoriensis TaxID=454156 RepID=UPI0031FA05AC